MLGGWGGGGGSSYGSKQFLWFYHYLHVLKQYDLHLTYALGGLCFARIFLLLINMVVVPQGCFSAACISEPAQPVLVDLNLNCGLTCTTCESRLRNGMMHVTRVIDPALTSAPPSVFP